MYTINNKFLIAITVILICTTTLLKAQFKITGKTVDSSTNRGLELVTVKLLYNDSSTYITGSDSLGNYSFHNLLPGAYRLTYSYLNYKEITTTFSLSRDTIIKVALSRSFQQLNTVNINAPKPIIERKIDRLIFNVSNNINVIGTDVLGLLSMTPRVKVDGNNVSIIGKEEVTIMVNDRQLQMSSEALAAYLKSIPAESVDRIEIMTNPSSIYSAQGSSGIINIIIKRNKVLGYNGSIAGNIRKSKAEGGRIDFNLNYNKSKFRSFENISVSKGAQTSTYDHSIYYPDLTQKDAGERKELSQYVRSLTGFESDLSPTDLLGASVELFYSFPYQRAFFNTEFINNVNNDLDSLSKQNSKDNISYKTIAANVHYVKMLDTSKNRKLVIDGDWSRNIFDQPNTITNTVYDAKENPISGESSQTISVDNQTSGLYNLNGVLFWPVKIGELSLGGRLNFINNVNHVLLDISQSKFTSQNTFKFKENTQALFFSYNKQIATSWTIQLGMRGEYTQTKGHSYGTTDSINTNQYFNVFPTIYLQHKINERNVITIDYGRRINRPSFSLLNPYQRYFSQYQSMEGNPLLAPYYSNNISLSETYRNNLTISIEYSFSNNAYSSIQIPQEDSRTLVYKNYNFLSNRYFQASSSYMIKGIKWLQSINELYISYTRSLSSLDITDHKTAAWSGAFRSNNTVYFNSKKTISSGAFFAYQYKDVGGLSKYGNYYFLNISARYLIWNNRLQLALDVSDLFKTKSLTSSYKADGVLYTSKVNNDTRRIGINIKYNFGNNKMKNGQAHSEEDNTGRAGG